MGNTTHTQHRTDSDRLIGSSFSIFHSYCVERHCMGKLIFPLQLKPFLIMQCNCTSSERRPSLWLCSPPGPAKIGGASAIRANLARRCCKCRREYIPILFRERLRPTRPPVFFLPGICQVKSSQVVTFIYIALITIQIVSKQLHNIKIGK